MTTSRTSATITFAMATCMAALALPGCADMSETEAEGAMSSTTGTEETSQALTAPSKAEIDAYAKAHGFPNSDYPYWEKANGCGSDPFNGIVPEGYPAADFTFFTPCIPTKNFNSVSFTSACNNHDHCYGTIGTSKSQCDSQLGSDIVAACNARLKSKPMIVCAPIPGRFLKGDSGSLARCAGLAATYQAAVSAVGGRYYDNGQAQARNYKALVDAFIASRS
jgi:hypothetical protein